MYVAVFPAWLAIIFSSHIYEQTFGELSTTVV